MKKILLVITFASFLNILKAQELFVFTEPASNMATKSIGFRLMNMLGVDGSNDKPNFHVMPEVMIGFSNKFMFHAQSFLSDVNGKFVPEGISGYAKYRFLSNDNVHQHFRMAAYGRASYNSALVHQDEIETMGHNSGFEGGIIATQLINKVAISSSISYEKAIFNNIAPKDEGQKSNALNYTFSVGKLMLPKEYTSYNQTNINLMFEVLGQNIMGTNKSFFDIAPSIQFIFNSVARLDLGYRTQVSGNMERTSTSIYLIKLEYNIFNAWGKK